MKTHYYNEDTKKAICGHTSLSVMYDNDDPTCKSCLESLNAVHKDRILKFERVERKSLKLKKVKV